MPRPELLRSFRHPGFALLWASICLNGYSAHISTVAITWLALEFTGSPIGVGVALAIRVMPRLFLAVPIGSLSDRMDRRTLLQATNFVGAGMSAAAAIASLQGWFGFGGVIAVAAVVGAWDVAETTIAKSYVYDVVGPDDAVNGMALEQMANKLFGVAGGVSSGVLLAVFGGVGVFTAMGVAYLLSAGFLTLIPRFASPAGDLRGNRAGELADGEAIGLRASVRELLRSPAVLVFAAIALSAEVFAYSHEVLAPSFARDILSAGERGLGNLVAARNAGGVVGLLLLGSVARRIRPDRLLPLVCLGFGGGLVLFALSGSYPVSLALMVLVGVAWASLDALLPTVIQQSVPDAERGAAVGIWNLSRGFGPLGELEIGALATVIGVAATQIVNGTLFAAIVVVMTAIYRRNERRDSRAVGTAAP